jgi:hypothetical protein
MQRNGKQINLSPDKIRAWAKAVLVRHDSQS